MTHSQNGLARWVRDLPPGFAALAPQPDSFGRGKVQRYMGTFTHPSLPSATFPPFSRLPPPSFPREQQKPSRPTHFSLDLTHTTTNFCPRTPVNSSLRNSRLQPTSSAHLPCNDSIKIAAFYFFARSYFGHRASFASPLVSSRSTRPL